MSKPIRSIYVHFLDYYHSRRAKAGFFATSRSIEREASLALRLSLLLSETSIIPVSSFQESALCRKILRAHPEFRHYGSIKLSAGDASIADHLEAKRTAYDERSPKDLLRAYQRKYRQSVPGYVQRRGSSTHVIYTGWKSIGQLRDVRRILDPDEKLGLGRNIETIWQNVPDMLEQQAFVPSHVAKLFEREMGRTMPETHFSDVIEPLYINGYTNDLGAAIITDLPTLRSPFAHMLIGQMRISYRRVTERLEGLGLLELVENARSNNLFRLRCHPPWNMLAAALISPSEIDKESMRIAIEIKSFMTRSEQSSLANRTQTQISLIPDRKSDVRIGIVTALPEEFAAVKQLIQEQEPIRISGDPNTYIVGKMNAWGGRFHYVSLTQLARMNNKSSAVAGANVLRSFPNLEVLLLSGIALAMPNPDRPEKHVRLGDIVVADRAGVIDCDHLVRSPGETVSRSILPPPSARLTRALNELDTKSLEGEAPWLGYLDDIVSTLPSFARPPEPEDVLVDEQGETVAHPVDESRTAGAPRIFRGVIGSGDTLIKDPVFRDRMRDEFDLLAAEMEGAGVAESAWQFEKYCMVIRGTCDYGRPKTDRWHKYAAAAAAAYLAALLAVTAAGAEG